LPPRLSFLHGRDQLRMKQLIGRLTDPTYHLPSVNRATVHARGEVFHVGLD
jgi:hypothetical protein